MKKKRKATKEDWMKATKVADVLGCYPRDVVKAWEGTVVKNLCPECGSEMFPQDPRCVEPVSSEWCYCVKCGHEKKVKP